MPAAVVRPSILSPSLFRIMPAPRNPIPVTTPVATRAVSPPGKALAEFKAQAPPEGDEGVRALALRLSPKFPLQPDEEARTNRPANSQSDTGDIAPPFLSTSTPPCVLSHATTLMMTPHCDSDPGHGTCPDELAWWRGQVIEWLQSDEVAHPVTEASPMEPHVGRSVNSLVLSSSRRRTRPHCAPRRRESRAENLSLSIDAAFCSESSCQARF
jgi:hypothetical protein